MCTCIRGVDVDSLSLWRNGEMLPVKLMFSMRVKNMAKLLSSIFSSLRMDAHSCLLSHV